MALDAFTKSLSEEDILMVFHLASAFIFSIYNLADLNASRVAFHSNIGFDFL